MTNTSIADDAFETPPPPEQLDTVEWKPTKVGDKLVGTLHRRVVANTKFGDKTVTEWVNVVECIADGEPVAIPDGHGVTWWPTPGGVQVLDVKQIRAGDKGGVRLNELKDTDKGNPFKLFGGVHLGAGDPFTPATTSTSVDESDLPF